MKTVERVTNELAIGPSGNSGSECMTQVVIDCEGEWVIEFIRERLGKCITERVTD